MNNPEETVKTPRSDIGIQKSNELYFDHYDKNEAYKSQVQSKASEEEKKMRKVPRINKASKKMVSKVEPYVPIYKRIGKVINKKQKNIDLLKTQILENKEREQSKEKEEHLQWKKTIKANIAKYNTLNENTTSLFSFKQFVSKEESWLKLKEQKQEDIRQKKLDEEEKYTYIPKVLDHSPASTYKSRSKEKKVWNRLYELAGKKPSQHFSLMSERCSTKSSSFFGKNPKLSVSPPM